MFRRRQGQVTQEAKRRIAVDVWGRTAMEVLKGDSPSLHKWLALRPLRELEALHVEMADRARRGLDVFDDEARLGALRRVAYERGVFHGRAASFSHLTKELQLNTYRYKLDKVSVRARLVSAIDKLTFIERFPRGLLQLPARLFTSMGPVDQASNVGARAGHVLAVLDVKDWLSTGRQYAYLVRDAQLWADVCTRSRDVADDVLVGLQDANTSWSAEDVARAIELRLDAASRAYSPTAENNPFRGMQGSEAQNHLRDLDELARRTVLPQTLDAVENLPFTLPSPAA